MSKNEKNTAQVDQQVTAPQPPSSIENTKIIDIMVNRGVSVQDAKALLTEHDAIFREVRNAKDFDFGAETAKVFDDMLGRSVPFYDETQRMIKDLVSEFAVDGTNIYDLGCSTGTTFLELDQNVPAGVRFVGIDSSAEMLEKAEQKLSKLTRPYELICADMNKGLSIENASVVIMNLTLQFVRPLYRDRIIQGIANGMNDNGCLILVEKVLSQDSTLNRLFIKFYYDFKRRNGYSDLEIAQKRESLENVLIPYRYEENCQLLLDNGFRTCDSFFRWFNFFGLVAIK